MYPGSQTRSQYSQVTTLGTTGTTYVTLGSPIMSAQGAAPVLPPQHVGKIVSGLTPPTLAGAGIPTAGSQTPLRQPMPMSGPSAEGQATGSENTADEHLVPNQGQIVPPTGAICGNNSSTIPELIIRKTAPMVNP